MLIVQKFGGSSVANKERVQNVARRIVSAYKKGYDVIVVLSAQGDTTDELLAKAKELNPRASKRELDMLLATGEQQSVALMAMAINGMGYPVVSLTGYQVGVETNSNYGNARIKKINTERLEREIARKNIVIVAGFQGINKFDDITTLGRGGSDTTAVAIAASLHADLCEIYTDVDGVYTADPRVVKTARKLPEIRYDEMLELASLGAKVLHNRSVELAKKYSVNLVVRSSMTDTEGTLVKEECKMEKMLVSGVASDCNVARISLIGIEDAPGRAFAIFSLLATKKISVDIILQSVGRENTKDISFTVGEDDLDEALSLLEANKERLTVQKIVYDNSVAKVSVVGAGIESNPGIAATMFEALYDANVNISMISTSEIKISVLIAEKDVRAAMISIHDKFNLGNPNVKME